MEDMKCFNPYFSGRYSATIRSSSLKEGCNPVSILILVEGTLQHGAGRTDAVPVGTVSILILVEGTLQQCG